MPFLFKFTFPNLGNLFLLCLFGSLFIQTRPTFIASLLAVGIGITVVSSRKIRAGLDASFFKQSYFIWGTLLIWPVMHLFIALVHSPFTSNQLGNPFRAVLAIGVFVFFARVPTKSNYLYAGTGVACLATFLHSGYDKLIEKFPRSLGWFNNENHYGDYSSLVGVSAVILAFLSAHTSNRVRYLLFFLGCLANIAAAASGTRTALLALICVFPLMFMKNVDRLHRQLRFILLLGAACAALAMTLSGPIRDATRVSEAISDIERMMVGKSQSSIGDRKQMWIAAVDMARTSPLIGVGLNKFESELEKRIVNKTIQPLMDKQNQAHSQILHSLATGGLILLITYLWLVCIPFFWFLQIYRKNNATSETRIFAYLGMSIIASHAFFGLTVAIFDIQVFSSVYFLSLATFAGLCIAQSNTQDAVPSLSRQRRNE